MGVHKTVKGAYRYRYAPFLMPTYYVKGCSPLALPLGELSPQVTERVLQPFTEIPVDIIVCPLRPRYARPPLPKGEARDARAVHRKVYRNALFISSANWSLLLNGDKLRQTLPVACAEHNTLWRVQPALLEHMNGVGENTSKNACISCLKIHI